MIVRCCQCCLKLLFWVLLPRFGWCCFKLCVISGCDLQVGLLWVVWCRCVVQAVVGCGFVAAIAVWFGAACLWVVVGRVAVVAV